MPPSLEAEGTANPVMDVELALATITAVGSYRLILRLVELVGDDVLIVRVKTNVLDGEAREIIESVHYADGQGAEGALARTSWYVVVDTGHGVEFTIEQTDGDAVRDYKYQIAKL